ALAIFDDYRELYGTQFRWTTNPKTGSWKKVKSGPAGYVSPHDWLPDAPVGDGWEFVFHGGDKKTDATDVAFYASGEPFYGVRDHDMSIVTCRFPIEDVVPRRFSLPTLLAKWCGLLRPWHGRLGFSVGRSFGYEDGCLSRLTETELLLRYPGLQFCNLSEGLYMPARRKKDIRAGLYDGPRCADWIIVLSDHFVDKLGGALVVRNTMAPLQVYEYSGGLILQADEIPQMGNYGEPENGLPEYAHLARIIEPVRARDLQHGLAQPDSTEADGCSTSQDVTDRWCARFSPKTAP
ncbi:MAG: DUF3396 domain-containing protein, partial [Zoogloeaceae bacterium]|nr:DUF3396 domain-containing protein [Zoogloeaceae bacterium]